jgi:hypothetical protein
MSKMLPLFLVKNHLHYRKVNARWVPCTLTDVNKMVRMQDASRLLQQFEDEGDAFLKSIVTTDETWVHYFIPESQQSSREWRHTILSLSALLRLLLFKNRPIIEDIRAKNHKTDYQRSD